MGSPVMKGSLVRFWLPELLGVDQELEGMLNLSGTLQWRGSLSTSEGKLQLLLKDTGVRAPKVKIPEKAARQWGMDSIQLSDLRLGTLEVKLALAEKSSIRQLRAVPGARDARAIHFEDVSVCGADVELVVDPQSALVLGRAGLGTSRVSVHAAVHLDEDFFTREVKKEGEEVERPNLFLRTILQGSAQARAAEKNGYYGFQCRGLMNSPNCSLMKPTMRVGLKKPASMAPARGEADEEKESVRPERKKPKSPATRAIRGGSAGAESGPATVDEGPRPLRGREAAADREKARKDRDERIRKLRESRAAGRSGSSASPSAVEAQDDEAVEDEEEDDGEEEPEEAPEEEEEETESDYEGEDEEESEDDPEEESAPEDGAEESE